MGPRRPFACLQLCQVVLDPQLQTIVGVSVSNKSKTRSRLQPLGAWSRGMIFASHFRRESDLTVKGREFNSRSVQCSFCSTELDLFFLRLEPRRLVSSYCLSVLAAVTSNSYGGFLCKDRDECGIAIQTNTWYPSRVKRPS
ncbi:hypothetical protein LX36DRAFT_220551 [Colletotrichum falcatum]|nr:hypothetical protein LX36DRAFT_220551 [Colletotrichum falcatum]